MKLLIPAHCIELTGAVQQALLLAKQQGFAIESIELGVSPTQSIQLLGQHRYLLQTDLFPPFSGLELSRQNLAAIAIGYQSRKSDSEIDNLDSATLLIGASYQGQQRDIWRHTDGELMFLSGAMLSPAQTWHHLAWLVAALCLEFALEDALCIARAALNVSRETWPKDYGHFPAVQSCLIEETEKTVAFSFPSLAKQSLGLYPVVDNIAWVESLLKLGINTLQLRIKNPQQVDLEQQIVRAIELGRQYQAQVFINDYWPLALKHGAFGVHLGQEDLQSADLDALAKANIHLGLSTHGYFELLTALKIRPSYIALGHIFPTTTKQMPSRPQGLVRLALYQQLVDSNSDYRYLVPASALDQQLTIERDSTIKGELPTVAIGGIDLTNIQSVVECGVASVAVVRAITEADDVHAAVKHLQAQLASKPQEQKLSTQEVADVNG
ncbi:thiamine phosphate synthase [Vibrio metschnikovii]|uniref:thiamine phosphate synthase n=1 Tax=Vibrio metschnikovii TaxID=28172 RepID=UPI002A38FC4E|nr:thiamine phosphate synthase [Vibrio metschnikovii]